ncbi:MAG: glycosyltransferase family 4 protein [Phycisphaerae bacterium]|nr:glycosyltransferase family 4 protein [Phycisphaerae bacterium]MDW8260905.1 glycosyltransferase family 4 protein [Phycisphaerales bacterium]
MRITFVLPFAAFGGGVRAVAMHARHLSLMGHQVTVVSTPRKPDPLRRRLGSALRGNGWPSPQPQASHLDELEKTPVRRILLDRFRPVENRDLPDADAVIATWWETAEWVAALHPDKGEKFYFVQHHEVVFDNQPTDRVEQTYRLPLHKIAVARWLSDLMRDQYGVPNVPVVPCGIDHTVFTAPPRGKQTRPTVGMMFARAAFKGCDIALTAFQMAARNVPGLTLRVFGEKPPAPPLLLPAGATFEQRPSQQRIAEIYSSCDAWLFASRSEGFGLPVLEAMACRTPVIGTPAGIAPEVLPEGGGVLVRPEDSADMAVAIERISRMKQPEWQAMSSAAFQTAKQFTWERSALMMQAILSHAVRHGKGRVAA